MNLKLSKSKTFWLVVVIAAHAAVAGLGSYFVFQHSSNKSSANGKLLSLSLLDTADRQVNLSQWRGKPMLINFWGTWCAPCREEMPLLNAAAQKYSNIQFVGISIDEAPAVRSYATQYPTSYPLLLGGFDILSLTSELGNSAQVLPFTVIVQADGAIKKVKHGPFRNEELSQELDSLANPR